MSHQPYETYLFSGETLSVDQQSCLDAHLKACGRCTRLAHAMTHLDMTFSTSQAPSPAPGFTYRFQARLATHREKQQSRNLWLMAIGLFALAGLIISTIILLHLNQINWAYELTQFIARTSLLAAQTRQFLNLLKPFRSALPLFIPLMLMLMTTALAFISVIFVIWFQSIIRLYSPVREKGHLS
jgi:predicted anti-sigma-YlaC factor YlaD